MYGESFDESNPIAKAIINYGGIPGMAAFKLLAVGCVIFFCQLIARQKPTLAKKILAFGACITGMVVVYSAITLGMVIVCP